MDNLMRRLDQERQVLASIPRPEWHYLELAAWRAGFRESRTFHRRRAWLMALGGFAVGLGVGIVLMLTVAIR